MTTMLPKQFALVAAGPERLRAQQHEAERHADHLFQALLREGL